MHKLSVYVAGDVGAFERELLNKFGGYSKFAAQGAWRSPQGQDYVEPSFLYHVFTEQGTEQAVSVVDTLFREQTTEQSVLVETEQGARFLAR